MFDWKETPLSRVQLLLFVVESSQGSSQGLGWTSSWHSQPQDESWMEPKQAGGIIQAVLCDLRMSQDSPVGCSWSRGGLGNFALPKQ